MVAELERGIWEIIPEGDTIHLILVLMHLRPAHDVGVYEQNCLLGEVWWENWASIPVCDKQFDVVVTWKCE